MMSLGKTWLNTRNVTVLGVAALDAIQFLAFDFVLSLRKPALINVAAAPFFYNTSTIVNHHRLDNCQVSSVSHDCSYAY